MTGLAPIDGWAVAAILVKTLEYGTALLALGGPLFLVTFRDAPDTALRVARTVAIGAAVLCLCLLALRFGIRSARISGMGMSGMADPVMLGLIWDSPLGSAALLRGLGAVLVLTLAVRGGLFQIAALIGSVLIAVSYTQVGHALGNPRWLLAGVLTLHLLAVGFWVAALAPLYRVTGTPGGSELLHRFGVIASVTVPLLVLAGVTFAWVMIGSLPDVFFTAYGWVLVSKISLFAALLSLAAYNKLRLVPALLGGSEYGITRLQRSIRLEGLCVLMILTVTAFLTSVTTPPVNL